MFFLNTTMSLSVPNICANLWNNDLLTMPKNPFVSRSYLFNGYKIKEVAVFGVVTSVERMKSTLTLYVDDGTGVVLCAYDETMLESHLKMEVRRLLDFYGDPQNTCQQGSMVLTWMLERTLGVFDGQYELQEGDSVYIMGKIGECSEELRVVTISFIYPLQDLRTEIILMELRNKFYEDFANPKNGGNSGQFAFDNLKSNDLGSDCEIDTEDSNKRKVNNSDNRTVDYYIGEWQEEYFFHREDDDGSF